MVNGKITHRKTEVPVPNSSSINELISIKSRKPRQINHMIHMFDVLTSNTNILWPYPFEFSHLRL